VFPAQRLGILVVTEIVGAAMIEIFAVVVLTQPPASPIIVYVVFTVGLAETLLPLAELNVALGLQV
jgi:3-deoxy-D-arabino-heptulosonate 7-phosphate (DAHP) synthase